MKLSAGIRGPDRGQQPAAKPTKVPEVQKKQENPKKVDPKKAAQKKPKASQVKTPPEPQPKEVVNQPATRLIHLSGVSVKLYSLKFPELEVEMEGLEANLPMGGTQEEGVVSLKKVHFLGEEMLSKWDLKVECRGNTIAYSRPKLSVFGMEIRIDGEMGMTRGFPVNLRVMMVAKNWKMGSLDSQLPRVDVRGMNQSHSFTGYLTSPTSWVGTSQGQYEGVELHDPEDGSVFGFISGQHVASIQNGVFRVVDFRMLGEVDSFLGNGFIEPDGEVAAVMRLVGTPERLYEHHHRIVSRKRKEKWGIIRQPLEGTDLAYSDVRVVGKIPDLEVNTGPEGSWVSFAELMDDLFGSQARRNP